MEELELDDMVVSLKSLPRLFADHDFCPGEDRELWVKIGLAALARGGCAPRSMPIVTHDGVSASDTGRTKP
jgi:hypothetical protein